MDMSNITSSNIPKNTSSYSNMIIRNVSHLLCDCRNMYQNNCDTYNNEKYAEKYADNIRLFNDIKRFISDIDINKIFSLYNDNITKQIPITKCMITDSIYKNSIDIFDILIRKYISSYDDKLIFDRLIINHIIEHDKYDFLKYIISEYDNKHVMIDYDTDIIINYAFNHNDNKSIVIMICNDTLYTKTQRKHILNIKFDQDKMMFRNMISRLEKDKREDTLFSIFSQIITIHNMSMILDKIGPKIKNIDMLIELLISYQDDEDIIRYIIESFDMNVVTINKNYFSHYVKKDSILYDIIVNEYRYIL